MCQAQIAFEMLLATGGKCAIGVTVEVFDDKVGRYRDTDVCRHYVFVDGSELHRWFASDAYFSDGMWSALWTDRIGHSGRTSSRWGLVDV
jgi:hypothetical protein